MYYLYRLVCVYSVCINMAFNMSDQISSPVPLVTTAAHSLMDLEAESNIYVNMNSRRPDLAAGTVEALHATTSVTFTTTHNPRTSILEQGDFQPRFDNNSTMYQKFEPNPVKPIPSFIYNVYNNSNHLKSWNIKFNGETCVKDFLNQVEETRAARDMDVSLVLRGFSELLQGSALKFYRSVRHTIHSWHDLCSVFNQNFLSIDFEYTTERMIRDMKQKANQSVLCFIIDVRDLNGRLVRPIPEDSLLEIVKHNLLPTYAQLLANNTVGSFDQLIALSRNYEAYSGHLGLTSFNQAASSTPTRNPTAQPPRPTNTRFNSYQPGTRFSQPPPANQNVVDTSRSGNNNFQQVITCLKCRRVGHHYSECRRIQGVMCFRCGMNDVITRTCPSCNSMLQQQKNSR